MEALYFLNIIGNRNDLGKKFPGLEIFRKETVSAEFKAIRQKLCRNCTFHKISTAGN